MEHLVEKFLSNKKEDLTLIEDDNFIYGKLSTDKNFFMLIKTKDTLFFDYDSFQFMTGMFNISDFTSSTYIKKYFLSEFNIKYSIFLPILNTGLYWYELDCVV